MDFDNSLANVTGCVLIGGQSRRMGRPKHLMRFHEFTLLEIIVGTLQSVTDTLLLVGEGSVPESLAEIPRIHDTPGVNGPMAGILSALYWIPRGGLIVCPCDTPAVQPDALRWLASCRADEWDIVFPTQYDSAVETMPAYYDKRAWELIRRQADRSVFQLQSLANHPRARKVMIPPDYRESWTNVNTPEDWAGWRDSSR